MAVEVVEVDREKRTATFKGEGYNNIVTIYDGRTITNIGYLTPVEIKQAIKQYYGIFKR